MSSSLRQVPSNIETKTAGSLGLDVQGGAWMELNLSQEIGQNFKSDDE